MKFLIDTCVISELIKKSPNPAIIEWISTVDEDDLFLSVITIGELKKGIFRLPDSKKKTDLKKWFIELESRFKGRILDIDKEIAEQWGTIQEELEGKGTPIPTLDSLIACTAMAKGLCVVTRNVRDIEKSGVEILNPWE